MTPAEIIRVLAKCAAYDNRTVGEANIRSWHEAIGDLDYAEALAAVTSHYASETEWIMPGHIRAIVIAERREIKRTTPHEVRALPSRFETDDERDARIAAGVAACRSAIPKPRHAAEAVGAEPSAIDVLRDLTDGPCWPDPDVAA